jgi:hypothetical protein
LPMASMQQNIIYQGNSLITIETHPEYSHPVVIKKSSKRHPSRRSLRSLESNKTYIFEYYIEYMDRVAMAVLIERFEAQAPDTAQGLQTLMVNFQFGRIRDLLGRLE